MAGRNLRAQDTSLVNNAPYQTIVQVPKPLTLNTGALTAAVPGTLTTAVVGLENVPVQINVSTIAFSVAALSTAGTFKVCIYNETNTLKLLDITSATLIAGTNYIKLTTPLLLNPGNYYFLIGWATTATSTTLNKWTSTTAAGWSTAPTNANGKLFIEGTLTKTTGVCDATMGTITPTVSSSPLIRLDN